MKHDSQTRISLILNIKDLNLKLETISGVIYMKKTFLLLIIPAIFFISCKPKPVERELVVIETSFGEITIDLFENVAPKHVENFKRLISEKFFDSLYFHRVIPGFMIQGGEPNTRDEDRSNDGVGQLNQPTVKAEFSKLKHKRGILSMARKGNDVNSGTSQFFIMVADYPSLDGQYSIFGKVVEGMDIADKIVSVPKDRNDNPIEHVYLKRVYLTKKEILPSPENTKDNL
jgi:cyclophilin family peptidyl-prolyl cis-trans isomerase